MIIPIKGDFIISAMAKNIANRLKNDSVDPPIIPTIFKNKIMEGEVEPFFVLCVIDVTQEIGRASCRERV